MLSKKVGADGFTQLGLMIAGTKFYGHPVSGKGLNDDNFKEIKILER
jgi:hypothetical protein